MRPIDDILADVIEALEPLESLPLQESSIAWSPLGLWLTTSCLRTSWAPVLAVDTGALIDAAAVGRGVLVEVMRVLTRAGAECYHEGESGPMGMIGVSDSEGETTREAVILALAKALGVETEESE